MCYTASCSVDLQLMLAFRYANEGTGPNSAFQPFVFLSVALFANLKSFKVLPHIYHVLRLPIQKYPYKKTVFLILARHCCTLAQSLRPVLLLLSRGK